MSLQIIQGPIFTCSITDNIFSISNQSNWVKASTETLVQLYKLIWIPQYSTANTSSTTGIKWNKNQHNTSIKKKNNQNINKPDTSKNFSSTTLKDLTITNLLTIVADFYIQSRYNFSKCISKLITDYSNFLSQNTEQVFIAARSHLTRCVVLKFIFNTS